MRRASRDESGQVTAYFVAISIVVFALMALAIDVGFFFHARRVAQNAADPAALAGAAYLQGCPLAGVGGGDPVTVATNYADKNMRGKTFTRADLAHDVRVVDFTPPGGTVPFQSVYTLVQRQQNYILAQFLPGLSGSFVTIPGEAQAVCGPIQTGSVCPMQISGDPNAPVTRDGSGNVTSAYGVSVGQVYIMKDSGDHIGALESPTGDGTDQWRDFIQDGCESDTGETLEVGEGSTVETKPGDFGNPTATAFEGGNGANSGGLYEIELNYEDSYGTDLFPYGHLDCDLHLTLDDPDDPDVVLEVRKYDANRLPTGAALTPAEVVTAINDMTDPDRMTGNRPPCGGLRSDGSVVSELVTESVQGRFMDIVMTNGSCSSKCDLPVLGIMRMYVVCWSGQESDGGTIPSGSLCVPAPQQKNKTTFYGVFADFTAPSVLGGGGLGTNPLAPKHVVLVK